MNCVSEARISNENKSMKEALQMIYELAKVENYSLSDKWFETLNEAFTLAEFEPIEREILEAVGF